jgi:tRNA1Val (adenine37-N6)-methyltransferase
MANDYFNFKKFTVCQDRCSFKVGTDGVLLGAYAHTGGAGRILDVGTGSGLIAIMLAQRTTAEIVALEPDHESFLQACDNVNRCSWNTRIKVLNTDFQGFSDDRNFDLIITNPPFFADSLKNPDPRKSASRHNASLPPEDILAGSDKLLNAHGSLQIILPFAEGIIFIAKARDYGFHCNTILNIKSLPGTEVKRVILGFSRKAGVIAEKELIIEKGARHEYSEDYINLTKEFYLKF